VIHNKQNRQEKRVVVIPDPSGKAHAKRFVYVLLIGCLELNKEQIARCAAVWIEDFNQPVETIVR
jgi:hypothetical protein